VSGNTIDAQRILSTAIRQVATLRGRLGAFQKNILETNVNSLSVALENVTASESAIRDADFASETAALTRAQILVQANTSVLSQANASPQNVLSLLQ
jgi:flagellin